MRRVSALPAAAVLAVGIGVITPATGFATSLERPTELRATGRLVFVDDPVSIQRNPDAGGTPMTAMLPDGSTLFLTDFDGRGVALHRLGRDGTLGPDSVRLPRLRGSLVNFVRGADGRIILADSGGGCG